MGHEIADVGLRPLVQHIVVFVNMEDVRRRDTAFPPFCPPSSERVIVTFNNHGHGKASPFQHPLQAHAGLGYLVEIVEVDIKD